MGRWGQNPRSSQLLGFGRQTKKPASQCAQGPEAGLRCAVLGGPTSVCTVCSLPRTPRPPSHAPWHVTQLHPHAHAYAHTRLHSSTHPAHTELWELTHPPLLSAHAHLVFRVAGEKGLGQVLAWPRMAAPDPRPPPPPMAWLLGPPRERCHRPSAPRASVEPVQLWRLLLWHSEGLPATQTADGQEMKAHSNTSQRTI